jgi:peptidoglycan hydrolase CwlO-like protein
MFEEQDLDRFINNEDGDMESHVRGEWVKYGDVVDMIGNIREDLESEIQQLESDNRRLESEIDRLDGDIAALEDEIRELSI